MRLHKLADDRNPPRLMRLIATWQLEVTHRPAQIYFLKQCNQSYGKLQYARSIDSMWGLPSEVYTMASKFGTPLSFYKIYFWQK
jgi:hypothetical protein